MQSCTLGFIFDQTLEHVLLIHKKRPAWQAGKLNGIGGKVEPGESPHACMVRECHEETLLSIPAALWQHFGTINESATTVDLFTTTYTGKTTDAQQNDHEAIAWVPRHNLPDTVIPNLHFLIPLAHQTLIGDSITSITITY